MRRPGRIDVLMARSGVVRVGFRRQAVSAGHAIGARTLNTGSPWFLNGMVLLSFVRGLYLASGHAILRMLLSKGRTCTVRLRAFGATARQAAVKLARFFLRQSDWQARALGYWTEALRLVA